MISRAAAAALLLLLSAGRSSADPELDPAAVASARADYQEGERLYALAEYEKALASFQSAFAKFPSPPFLLHIAHCHRRLGHRAEAIQSLRNYLERAPGASDREPVEQEIRDLDAEITEERLLRAEPAPRPAPVPSGPTPLYQRPLLWIAACALIVATIAAVSIGVALSTADAPVPPGYRIDVRFP